jgi:hypothetical protein
MERARIETSQPHYAQQSTKTMVEEPPKLQRTCSDVAKKQPNMHGRAKKPRPADDKENMGT